MRRWSLDRFIVIASATFLLCVGSPATANDSGPLRLRILSYNIHHGEGVDGRLDLERIAGVIKSAAPELVALQEVDQMTMRTGKVDQPAELARLTAMHVFFGGNIPYQGGQYGNAVLSSRPIKRQANHRLPHLDGGEQRGVLEVEVELGVDQPTLLFCDTHFDARRGDAERILSAKFINDLAARRAEAPRILAGDLNDTPTSETLRVLSKAWSRAGDKPLGTVPVERPVRQIDFILFGPHCRWRLVEVRVLDERVSSDHRPLLAVLELMPQAAKPRE